MISADSRQVYRRMNLGTGKDYNDYIVSIVFCKEDYASYGHFFIVSWKYNSYILWNRASNARFVFVMMGAQGAASS